MATLGVAAQEGGISAFFRVGNTALSEHVDVQCVCLLPPCSDTLSTHQWHHKVFSMSNLSALPVPLANQVPIISALLNRCSPVNVLTGDYLLRPVPNILNR